MTDTPEFGYILLIAGFLFGSYKAAMLETGDKLLLILARKASNASLFVSISVFMFTMSLMPYGSEATVDFFMGCSAVAMLAAVVDFAYNYKKTVWIVKILNLFGSRETTH